MGANGCAISRWQGDVMPSSCYSDCTMMKGAMDSYIRMAIINCDGYSLSVSKYAVTASAVWLVTGGRGLYTCRMLVAIHYAVFFDGAEMFCLEDVCMYG